LEIYFNLLKHRGLVGEVTGSRSCPLVDSFGHYIMFYSEREDAIEFSLLVLLVCDTVLAARLRNTMIMYIL